MTLTTEQLALRRTGIMATDVGIICNVNPYETPLHLWLEKTGREVPDDDPDRDERFAMGHALEPVTRAAFERRHGVTVRHDIPTTLRSTPDVVVGATPDGIIDAWQTGWEGKSHTVALRGRYGEEGTDEVPTHELLQCQTGMLVTGLRAWRLSVFLDNKVKHFNISADDGMHSDILEVSARWWRDYIVADKPPPITPAHPETDRLLRRIHPRDNGMIRGAADDEKLLILELRRVLAEHEAQGDEVERLKDLIKDAIGDDAGLQFSEDKRDRVTWKKSKDSKEVDWQSAAYDFAGRIQLLASHPLLIEECGYGIGLGAQLRPLIDAIRAGIDAASYTTTKPGSRRFLTPRHWSTK